MRSNPYSFYICEIHIQTVVFKLSFYIRVAFVSVLEKYSVRNSKNLINWIEILFNLLHMLVELVQ